MVDFNVPTLGKNDWSSALASFKCPQMQKILDAQSATAADAPPPAKHTTHGADENCFGKIRAVVNESGPNVSVALANCQSKALGVNYAPHLSVNLHAASGAEHNVPEASSFDFLDVTLARGKFCNMLAPTGAAAKTLAAGPGPDYECEGVAPKWNFRGEPQLFTTIMDDVQRALSPSGAHIVMRQGLLSEQEFAARISNCSRSADFNQEYGDMPEELALGGCHVRDWDLNTAVYHAIAQCLVFESPTSGSDRIKVDSF